MRLTLMGRVMHRDGRFHIDSRFGAKLVWARTGMESARLGSVPHPHSTGGLLAFGATVLLHGGHYYYYEYILDFSVFWRLGCRPRAEYQFCLHRRWLGYAGERGPWRRTLQRNGRRWSGLHGGLGQARRRMS